MVKIEELGKEGERLELSELESTMELKAISETVIPDRPGKKGGLQIVFQTRDGKTFPQKYTGFHQVELRKALERLGLEDTVELQKAWYQYKLQPFRIGNPRMIPVKKVK